MTTLSALIKKRASGSFATAIPATTATPADESIEEVAKIATVAVANPAEEETEARHQRVLKMLATEPEKKYAVLAENTTADPVLVTVGIRGLATFDLEIPHAHYDGLALLEVIEQHSIEAALKLSGGTPTPTDQKERSLRLPDEPAGRNIH